MKTRKIAALAFAVMLGPALTSCSSGEAEEAARRSLVIEDYVLGQQANYGWAEGATKVSDEEGFALVEQTSSLSSYYASQNYVESNDGDPFATYSPSCQVEADLLKHSLKKNVLMCVYSSDGYLMSLNFGRYPDASEQAQQSTEDKLEEITASAEAFAASNKEAWLAGFEAYVFEHYKESFSSVEHETGESETAIRMMVVSGGSAIFDDEDGQRGFDQWWQRFSDSITLYLGTGVRLEFVSSDTGEVERAFESPAREYLYTPNKA